MCILKCFMLMHIIRNHKHNRKHTNLLRGPNCAHMIKKTFSFFLQIGTNFPKEKKVRTNNLKRSFHSLGGNQSILLKPQIHHKLYNRFVNVNASSNHQIWNIIQVKFAWLPLIVQINRCCFLKGVTDKHKHFGKKTFKNLCFRQ